MSTRHDSYESAALDAARRCRATGYRIDYGIRRTIEFGQEGFNVSTLPRPEFCAGSELRAERIDEAHARMILAQEERPR